MPVLCLYGLSERAWRQHQQLLGSDLVLGVDQSAIRFQFIPVVSVEPVHSNLWRRNQDEISAVPRLSLPRSEATV